jgi:hypothetical protein
MAGGTGDGGAALSATFTTIRSICIDTIAGYLYVSDVGNHTVRKISLSTGIISACAGTGISGFSGDGGLAVSAQLTEPTGLCVDKFGNLYIGDEGNRRIRKVDAITGVITTIAGTGAYSYSGDGGPAVGATFATIRSLAADSCSNLYFSDQINHVVRKIEGGTGIINTIAGSSTSGYWGDGGPAWTAWLNHPIGVIADNEGKLYIADRFNQRIRLVTIPPTGGTPSITTASTTVCARPTLFNAVVTGGVGVGYQWIVNGTPVTGATNSTYTYTPASGDSIRCIVVSAGHCNGTVTGSSNTLYMTVNPVITPSISITGVSMAAFGSSVTVSAVVSGAGSSYNIKWMNKGVVFATTSVPMVTYTKLGGIDTITAEVVSTSPGCYDTVTSAMHMVAQTNVRVEMVFPATVMVVPNPAHDDVLVCASGTITHIAVTDLTGQKLVELHGNTATERLEISVLPAGIYMVSVTLQNGWKSVIKMVKE